MVQWQTIPIDLFAGVDTKTEDKRVLSGRLLTSENSRLDERGIVRKRKGYAALNKDLVDSPFVISSGRALGTFDGVLSVLSEENRQTNVPGLLYFTEQDSNWVLRNIKDTANNLSPCDISQEGASSSFAQMTDPCVAVAQGLVMVAYITDDASGVDEAYLSVFDEVSKVAYIKHAPYSGGSGSSRKRPFVCASDNKFYAGFVSSGDNNLYVATIAVDDIEDEANDFNPAFTATSKATDVHADSVLDACKVDSTKCLIVYKDTSGDIQMRQLNDSAADDTASFTGSAGPGQCISCEAVTDGGTDKFLIAYDKTAGSVQWYLRLRSPFGNTDSGPFDFGSATDVRQISTKQSGTNYAFAYEDQAATKYVVHHSVRDSSNSETRVVDSMTSVRMASKVFSQDNSWFYWLQPQDGVLDDAGYALVRFFPGTNALGLVGEFLLERGSKVRSDSALSDVYVDGSTRYVAALTKDDILASQGVVLSKAVAVVSDFSSVLPAYQNTQSGAIVGSGGIRVVSREHAHHAGFLFRPSIVSTAQASTGGSMSDGTHTYVLVSEWISYKGEIYRSAVSDEVSITLTGGTSTQKVTLTIATIPEPLDSREYKIHVYRTQASGNIFYKTGANGEKDSSTIEDTAADATIASNEIIYTNGGVLENNYPKSTNILASGIGRLFYVPFSARKSVYHSKKKAFGVGFEFNDSLVKVVNSDGDLTALGVIDDKVIAFSRDRTYFTFGEGPNSLGTGPFPDFRDLSTDVGCVNQNSVVSTHIGLFFKSDKGIYLLDRALQTHYVGADVEEFNSDTVLRALLHDAENQVLFLLDNDKVLVYQYNIDQEAPNAGFWSVWTGHTNMVDGTIYDNNFVWADSAAQVYEQDSSFTDGSTSYSLKLITNWIALAGLAGFQRIRRLSFLGDMPTDHTLTIKVYYDFDDTLKQTLTIDTSADITGNVLEFRRRLNKQKCEAIKFEISDSSGSGTEENYRVNQLALEVGVKRGINRIQTAG